MGTSAKSVRFGGGLGAPLASLTEQRAPIRNLANQTAFGGPELGEETEMRLLVGPGQTGLFRSARPRPTLRRRFARTSAQMQVPNRPTQSLSRIQCQTFCASRENWHLYEAVC